MKIAMLSPIAWRTPPLGYGPWERVVSLLTEGLAVRGIDVTLFATADSVTPLRQGPMRRTRPLTQRSGSVCTYPSYLKGRGISI